MTTPNGGPHDLARLDVRTGTDPVPAGRDLTLTAVVACAHGCDLRGHGVVVRDAAGAELARAEIVEPDPFGWRSGPLVLAAPRELATVELVVAFPDQVRGGVRHAAAQAAVTYATRAHPTSVLVWDVPSTASAGGTDRVHVGAKCRCGCSLAGAPVEVIDAAGAVVAAATLGDGPWPGTDGLYAAAVDVAAGSGTGLALFRARYAGAGAELPHEPAEAAFRWTVVPEPAAEVRITALLDDGRPVPRATVAMHPYRAVTDEEGTAVLRAAAGTYRLFVSRAGYMTFGAELDLERDVEIEARLHVEPEEDPGAYY